jgi:nucleotide-binding universal stress UspA family protein
VLERYDARGDPRQMGQLLAAQASETGRRFRQAWGEGLIDGARYKAKDKKVKKFHGLLVEGGSARTILKLAADRKVDLIVMGRRGLGDLQGLLLGSVSHKVSNLAECACLTVK